MLRCTAAGHAVRGRVAPYARLSGGQRPTMLIVTCATALQPYFDVCCRLPGTILFSVSLFPARIP